MKIKYIFLCIMVFFVLSACSKEIEQANADETDAPNIVNIDGFVFVHGGSFVNTNSNLYDTIATVDDFYIGIYEVTQSEWIEVMGSNPSEFAGENNPVETINWYDAIEYCIRRSELEGLQPYYNIDRDNIDPNNLGELDDLRWTVTINPGANGYRLPTEVEWEYAASGGQLSQSFYYSGSDDPDEVAWYYRNCGDVYMDGFWHWGSIQNNNGRPHPVGQKLPNELGLYDMSGNVREWCWDWYGEETFPESGEEGRVIRGGGWVGQENPCAINYRANMEPHYRFNDIGLRLVRDVFN